MWVPADSPLITELWPDAPSDPDVLDELLEASYEQCAAYVPGIVETPVPSRYRIAQVMQARAIQRSLVSGTGDQMGGDGYTVTVFPMDWNVRNLLRPRSIGRVL